jgi:hypothetical protein
MKHKPFNLQVATLLSGLSCLISHIYIYTHSEHIKDTHTVLGLILIIIMNISGWTELFTNSLFRENFGSLHYWVVLITKWAKLFSFEFIQIFCNKHTEVNSKGFWWLDFVHHLEFFAGGATILWILLGQQRIPDDGKFRNSVIQNMLKFFKLFYQILHWLITVCLSVCLSIYLFLLLPLGA